MQHPGVQSRSLLGQGYRYDFSGLWHDDHLIVSLLSSWRMGAIAAQYTDGAASKA
jgi:hypothetical protein